MSFRNTAELQMMSETDFEQMVSPSMDFLKGRKDNFWKPK